MGDFLLHASAVVFVGRDGRDSEVEDPSLLAKVLQT